MKDSDCTQFLQWALPRMQLRWAGFRKVRRLVCKRVDRRCMALGLPDVMAYRQWLDTSAAEWDELRGLCAIPISRFCRDWAVFDALKRTVLPELAGRAADGGQDALECWSAGCASGEEPYSLSMVWQLGVPHSPRALALRILATDIDAALLVRASTACYRASALKEVPKSWRTVAFERRGEQFCLCDQFRMPVTFARQDFCTTMPARSFDLILCRNAAFTYLERPVQQRIAAQFAERLRLGGALIIGIHEELPVGTTYFVRWRGLRAIYRKDDDKACSSKTAREGTTRAESTRAYAASPALGATLCRSRVIDTCADGRIGARGLTIAAQKSPSDVGHS
jgi:chemotaxis protein methyltransferase CheR